jgi:tRNA dimethylallyltransferase
MFDGDALVTEVHDALSRGVSRDALDRAGIGYREGLALIDGVLTTDAAKAQVLRRTLRYAKAQRTWFRGDGRVRWLRWRESPVDVLEQAAALVAAHVAG